MIRGGFALFVFVLTLAPVCGQERTPGSVPKALSPRNANYSIAATLDAQRRTLTGRETITWTNTSTAAVTELQAALAVERSKRVLDVSVADRQGNATRIERRFEVKEQKP